MNQEPIKLTGQLYDIRTKRDGGSRVTLDCGAESLASIQQLVGLMALGDINLAVVLVPYRNDLSPQGDGITVGGLEVDENGEIQI